MGKFDGILMCSDIDWTILDHTTKPLAISKENRDAIRYFQAEGGLFTIATGRVLSSMSLYTDDLPLSAPVITHNGAAIYDRDSGDCLFHIGLDEQAREAVRYVDAHFPDTGIEIYTEHQIYAGKGNAYTCQQFREEALPYKEQSYETIPFPWLKVLFAQSEEQTTLLRSHMEQTPFFRQFNFTQSSHHFYEIIHKNADKGVTLKKLCELCHVDPERTIALGDGYNDKEMLTAAKIGIAPKNAVPEALAAADYISVPCGEHVLPDVIQKLEAGKFAI